MFKCQLTGRQSLPGEKPVRVVVETRAKTYTNWDRDTKEDKVTYGTEIVREITVCQQVYQERFANV